MKAEQWAIFWVEIDSIRGGTETNDAVILFFFLNHRGSEGLGGLSVVVYHISKQAEEFFIKAS